MARNIPVLQYLPSSFNAGDVAIILCDNSIDAIWNVSLQGTNASGDLVIPTAAVIDNTGINASVKVQLGIGTYTVSPYTRKTFKIPPGQNSIVLTTSAGSPALAVFDFDPGIPDEVNQVASGVSSNQATGGGGSGAGVAMFTTNNGVDLSISGAGLVVTVTGSANAFSSALANTAESVGKFYFEATATSGIDSGMALGIGVLGLVNLNDWMGYSGGVVYQDYSAQGFYYVNNGPVATGVLQSWTVGDTAACAVDLSAKLIWWRKGASGFWNNSPTADPSSGVGGISFAVLTGPFRPGLAVKSAGNVGAVSTANFGQNPYLGSVPTGFSSWS